jgi:hypothetical protein
MILHSKMKKYSISKPEKYMKDGVEKTYWANVGTMTEFDPKQDGTVGRLVEIPAIGLKASLFEQTPRAATTPALQTDIMPEIQGEEDPVNPDDIPF